MTAVGFTLQPEALFLDVLDELIHTAIDYAEIAPETTWFLDATGPVRPNGFHARFAELVASAGLFTVAHGVGLSLGGAADGDEARQAAWLARVRADCEVFGFRWYSEHLGATALDGEHLTLPLPVPMTATSAALIRSRLRAMQSVVPEVGVENSGFYFLWGEPLAEADFLGQLVRDPGHHLVLDLHNLYTLACNFDVEPAEYLARLPLERVIELHVSGGCDSDPAWLAGGATMRLDSHDGAVPEPVWRLLETVAPRCPGLRGITLERMESTVSAADVPSIAEELARVRAVAERC
ncbi:DUF692 domain-containing protein [Haliangium ochraceum]|uniref:Xylose isomerase domain protein TIM barrel n=1 Tax=Haliangium ochraceum (strain DSM 14365 / JCM 11303 / SMP-2) TaxID=502025 RepID=D0LSL1_HALO1|nr:DUF692 family multinuclear iron-containing protein [Haliangium ochraceum]ACY17233.1 protein of unknown function DUF692 [Haliangium ochraceum DSM 14365]